MNIDSNQFTNDIICAISTAPGMGAIAVVRLSGEGSIALVDKRFESPHNKKLVDQQPYSVHFGKLMDNTNVLDEVLITLFHAPHSFTGEESVEIACHGSVYIQQKLMEVLLHAGARMAQAGEFTRRAFTNGKFDLSQAEAVADLIASTSATSHRVSLNQMRGGFTNKIAQLRDTLLQFASLIELELNPELTANIPDEMKFMVYVSALTSISLDNHNWIPASDNRLLRRMTRDYTYRNYSAMDTISRWSSVRRGEEKWIFPYQENADVMFNSAMIYELGSIRRHVEPILRQVPRTAPEYAEAYRLLKFLSYFNYITDRELPPTSLLREFVGGSSFRY